jgi:hypothetical protein
MAIVPLRFRLRQGEPYATTVSISLLVAPMLPLIAERSLDNSFAVVPELDRAIGAFDFAYGPSWL